MPPSQGFSGIRWCRDLPYRQILLALGIVLAQIGFLIAIAHQPAIDESYIQGASHFDSIWYNGVMSGGYTYDPADATKRADIVILPGYPLLLARGVRQVLLWIPPLAHIWFRDKLALLLAAQIPTVGFWTYFLLFCKRWKTPWWLTAGSLILLVSHPASFYLVSAYTEGLFFMMMFGLLYWLLRGEGLRNAVIGGLHGFGASITRITGALLFVIPFVLAFLSPRTRSSSGRLMRWARAFMVSALTVGGLFSYLLYIWKRYGDWMVYFRAHWDTWNQATDLFRLLDWRVYKIGAHPILNVTRLEGIIVPFTAACFITYFIVDVLIPFLKKQKMSPVRLTFAFSAFLVMYLAVSGAGHFSSTGPEGRYLSDCLLRYALPVHALLLLAIVHFISEKSPRGRLSYLASGIMVAVALPLLVYQGYLMHLLYAEGRFIS